MDTLKRLARWVLREELRDLRTEGEYLDKVMEDYRKAVRRSEGQRIEQHNRVRQMRQWGRDTQNTVVLAWADLITQAYSDSRGHGVVHPFDRWGVSPKP